jgi:beta-mannosidase
VAVLPYLDGDKFKIYGVNDLADSLNVTLHIHAYTFEGSKLIDFNLPGLMLNTDSSKVLWEGTLKSLLNGKKADKCVIELQLTDSSETTVYSTRNFYSIPSKKMNLPNPGLRITAVDKVENGYLLTLETNNLAKNVYLQTDEEGFFSNNYFDLLPGRKTQVIFKTNKELSEPKKAFRVKTLIDAVE